MSSSNLPPGCSVSDIPGNRPEDARWDRIMEALGELSIDDAERAVAMGIAALGADRAYINAMAADIRMDQHMRDLDREARGL